MPGDAYKSKHVNVSNQIPFAEFVHTGCVGSESDTSSAVCTSPCNDMMIQRHASAKMNIRSTLARRFEVCGLLNSLDTVLIDALSHMAI